MSATTQVVLDDSSIRVPDETFINIELCSNAYCFGEFNTHSKANIFFCHCRLCHDTY